MNTSTTTIELGQIAHARSGDKGNHANLGVVAFTAAGFDFLSRELSEQRVAEFFKPWGASKVVRYELPKIWGLNFVLEGALAGGASRSLRIDTQGKLLGTLALELRLPRPDNLAQMIESGR